MNVCCIWVWSCFTYRIHNTRQCQCERLKSKKCVETCMYLKHLLCFFQYKAFWVAVVKTNLLTITMWVSRPPPEQNKHMENFEIRNGDDVYVYVCKVCVSIRSFLIIPKWSILSLIVCVCVVLSGVCVIVSFLTFSYLVFVCFFLYFSSSIGSLLCYYIYIEADFCS